MLREREVLRCFEGEFWEVLGSSWRCRCTAGRVAKLMIDG